MKAISNIAIFCKPFPPENCNVLSDLSEWLRQNGYHILLDQETASWVGELSYLRTGEVSSQADLIIVLGGDGTLLRVAGLTHPHEVPILAVNLGSLGFITEIALQEFREAFVKAIDGSLNIEKRMLLNVTLIRQGQSVQNHSVLNEAVVDKGSLAKIVDLEVYVDNVYMTSYRADGLIIATPTGSTAYSLSAGGPIIHPSMNALVLSPICPFALTNRPIVAPDRSEIEVRLAVKSQEARVTLDGQQSYVMKREDSLKLKKGDNHILLYQSPYKNFYQILREKLKWGGSKDNEN